MKRFLIILLTFIMSVFLLLTVGCGASCAPDNSGTDQGQNTPNDVTEITEMYITVNGNKLKVTLEQNSSVNALVELLKQGDITYTAHANSFEIYGDIGHSLPTNNTHITSKTGDVLLWAGSNIYIFFGNNSYSYTRIGKINGYSASELRTLLGADQGSVQVTISLQ
ncbi:MAG: hypothetical protein J1F61_03185 [Clostridiales bacterium]|nr:hypothetical protein [Clostridiales bacterium]